MWPFKKKNTLEKVEVFREPEEVFRVLIKFDSATFCVEFKTIEGAQRELNRIKKNLNTKGKRMMLLKDGDGLDAIVDRKLVKAVYIEKKWKEVKK